MVQQELYSKLGENVRRLRMSGRLTQQELAEMVNLTRVSIANIESGRQRPPVHFFYDLAASLNVDISQVFPTLENAALARKNASSSEEEALLERSLQRATRRLETV